MRGSHERMIEFVDAFEKDGHFFAVVDLQSRRFQFGVSKIGYRSLRQAMQLRPFDMMPGRKYRYFISDRTRRGDLKNTVWKYGSSLTGMQQKIGSTFRTTFMRIYYGLRGSKTLTMPLIWK